MRRTFWMTTAATVFFGLVLARFLAVPVAGAPPFFAGLPGELPMAVAVLTLCGVMWMAAQVATALRGATESTGLGVYRLAGPVAVTAALGSATLLGLGLQLGMQFDSPRLAFDVFELHVTTPILVSLACLATACWAGRARPAVWRRTVTVGLAGPASWYAVCAVVSPWIGPVLKVWVRSLTC